MMLNCFLPLYGTGLSFLKITPCTNHYLEKGRHSKNFYVCRVAIRLCVSDI